MLLSVLWYMAVTMTQMLLLLCVLWYMAVMMMMTQMLLCVLCRRKANAASCGAWQAAACWSTRVPCLPESLASHAPPSPRAQCWTSLTSPPSLAGQCPWCWRNQMSVAALPRCGGSPRSEQFSQCSLALFSHCSLALFSHCSVALFFIHSVLWHCSHNVLWHCSHNVLWHCFHNVLWHCSHSVLRHLCTLWCCSQHAYQEWKMSVILGWCGLCVCQEERWMWLVWCSPPDC